MYNGSPLFSSKERLSFRVLDIIKGQRFSFFQNFGIECKLSVYTKAPGRTAAINSGIRYPWQKRDFYGKR